MSKYVTDQKAAGKTLLFVAVVGDIRQLLLSGQSGDTWSQQCSNVYGTQDPSSVLYGVPFLAVMGNHDYGDTDPYAAYQWVRPFATVGRRPGRRA